MTRCKQVNYVLITIFLIPFILMFRPVVIIFKMFDNPLYAPNGWRWCCPFKRWTEDCFSNSCCGKAWIIYVTVVIIIPCIFVLAFIIGCFNLAIFYVPAFLYQTLRLIRVSCYRCTFFIK